MLPAYPQSHPAELHTPPPCDQDQSLQQLVWSRSLRDPSMASPTCLGAPLHPSLHHKDMPTPDKLHQQPAACKLTKQQSGNPFASELCSIQGTHTGLDQQQQASSLLRHAVSGNPFAEVAAPISPASKPASSQDQTAGAFCSGLCVAQQGSSSSLCLERDKESGTLAGSSAQEHTQSGDQPALQSCAGLAASPAASSCVLNNLEMSPLQNGLIRWASHYCLTHTLLPSTWWWPLMPLSHHPRQVDCIALPPCSAARALFSLRNCCNKQQAIAMSA